MDPINPQVLLLDIKEKCGNFVNNFYAPITPYVYMAFNTVMGEYIVAPFIPSLTGYVVFGTPGLQEVGTRIFTIPSANLTRLPKMFSILPDDDFYTYQNSNIFGYLSTAIGFLTYVEKDGFLSPLSQEDILHSCFEYTTCAVYNTMLGACQAGYEDNAIRVAQIIWNSMCYNAGVPHLFQNFEGVASSAFEVLQSEENKPSAVLTKSNNIDYDEEIWNELKRDFMNGGSNEDTTSSNFINDDAI